MDAEGLEPPGPVKALRLQRNPLPNYGLHILTFPLIDAVFTGIDERKYPRRDSNPQPSAPHADAIFQLGHSGGRRLRLCGRKRQAEDEGVEPSRTFRPRPASNRVPSPVGLIFHGAPPVFCSGARAQRGIRTRRGDLLQVPPAIFWADFGRTCGVCFEFVFVILCLLFVCVLFLLFSFCVLLFCLSMGFCCFVFEFSLVSFSLQVSLCVCALRSVPGVFGLTFDGERGDSNPHLPGSSTSASSLLGHAPVCDAPRVLNDVSVGVLGFLCVVLGNKKAPFGRCQRGLE